MFRIFFVLIIVRRICDITVRLDFIFRLVHCGSEDVSFTSVCLNVLEGIKQFYLLIRFKPENPTRNTV